MHFTWKKLQRFIKKQKKKIFQNVIIMILIHARWLKKSFLKSWADIRIVCYCINISWLLLCSLVYKFIIKPLITWTCTWSDWNLRFIISSEFWGILCICTLAVITCHNCIYSMKKLLLQSLYIPWILVCVCLQGWQESWNDIKEIFACFLFRCSKKLSQ